MSDSLSLGAVVRRTFGADTGRALVLLAAALARDRTSDGQADLMRLIKALSAR